MPDGHQHIIGKEVVNIDYRGTQRMVRSLHGEMSALLNEEVEPLLEAIMDRYDDGRNHIRIDKLEISIDKVNRSNLSQISAKIAKAFEEKLKKRIHYHFEQEEDTGMVVVTEEKQVWEAFLFFIRTGQLPWWSISKANLSEMEELVSKFITKSNFWQQPLFQLLSIDQMARQRLIWQFSDPFLASLNQILTTSSIPDIIKIQREWDQLLLTIQLPPTTNRTQRNYFWKSVLLTTLTRSTSKKQWAVSLIQTLFQQIVQSLSSGKTTTSKHLLWKLLPVLIERPVSFPIFRAIFLEYIKDNEQNLLKEDIKVKSKETDRSLFLMVQQFLEQSNIDYVDSNPQESEQILEIPAVKDESPEEKLPKPKKLEKEHTDQLQESIESANVEEIIPIENRKLEFDFQDENLKEKGAELQKKEKISNASDLEAQGQKKAKEERDTGEPQKADTQELKPFSKGADQDIDKETVTDSRNDDSIEIEPIEQSTETLPNEPLTLDLDKTKEVNQDVDQETLTDPRNDDSTEVEPIEQSTEALLNEALILDLDKTKEEEKIVETEKQKAAADLANTSSAENLEKGSETLSDLPESLEKIPTDIESSIAEDKAETVLPFDTQGEEPGNKVLEAADNLEELTTEEKLADNADEKNEFEISAASDLDNNTDTDTESIRKDREKPQRENKESSTVKETSFSEEPSTEIPLEDSIVINTEDQKEIPLSDQALPLDLDSPLSTEKSIPTEADSGKETSSAAEPAAKEQSQKEEKESPESQTQDIRTSKLAEKEPSIEYEQELEETIPTDALPSVEQIKAEIYRESEKLKAKEGQETEIPLTNEKEASHQKGGQIEDPEKLERANLKRKETKKGKDSAVKNEKNKEESKKEEAKETQKEILSKEPGNLPGTEQKPETSEGKVEDAILSKQKTETPQKIHDKTSKAQLPKDLDSADSETKSDEKGALVAKDPAKTEELQEEASINLELNEMDQQLGDKIKTSESIASDEDLETTLKDELKSQEPISPSEEEKEESIPINEEATEESDASIRALPKEKRWQPERRPVRIPKEGVFIDNAGLVILHPYLPMFFEAVGLVKDKAFLNEESCFMGVNLLGYLVSGELGLPEFTMTLNKLLCGLPLDEPIDTQMQIREDAKAEANKLLQAVINNWKVLGNSSPDSLRVNFLQRKGKLTYKDSGWLLQVVKETPDVLINRLPWGMSVIKLPWMDEPLYTEW